MPSSDDNADDDLYCEPFSDLPSTGILHDPPSTMEGLNTEMNPWSPDLLKDPSPPPPFRMSNEWAEIDKQYTLYEAQQLDNDGHRLEVEISWREEHFRRLARMCAQHVPVRFARPMSTELISQLLNHPNLLLRYFQNERRIARANQCCELQVQRMNRVHGIGLGNFYTKEQMFRRAIMRHSRLKYEVFVKQLFIHISKCLYALVGQVQDLTDDEPLTLLDDILVAEIINQSADLRNELRENGDIERQVASHRFIGRRKYTGHDVFDEEDPGEYYNDVTPLLAETVSETGIDGSDFRHPEQYWEY